MTADAPVLYNTNLSKAQGLVPETLELLQLWEPGMSAVDLKARVKETGALARSTDTRISDVVTRGFAQRYLIEEGMPARCLKTLADSSFNRSALRQLFLVYTARHNPIFADFLTSVFWRKATSHTQEVTKADTRDFLERACAEGRIQPRWADSMMERVTRYLLGTLEDFQLIEENRLRHRLTKPPTLALEAAVYLAYDLHARKVPDNNLLSHADWQLFGMSPTDVLSALERAASHGYLQIQNAGQLLRIEWIHPTMEQLVNALANRQI
jgi:hypothetical protein